MADYYFTSNLDNDRMLCLAPLTDRKIGLSGQEITDTSGYFLYEQRRSNDAIEVISHVTSEEAAFRLRDMLKLE